MDNIKNDSKNPFSKKVDELTSSRDAIDTTYRVRRANEIMVEEAAKRILILEIENNTLEILAKDLDPKEKDYAKQNEVITKQRKLNGLTIHFCSNYINKGKFK